MRNLYTIILFLILFSSINKLNAESKIATLDSHKNNEYNKAIDLASPTATITGTTAVCQGATSPVITFTGSGGTAPYTFTYKLSGVAQTISTIGTNSSVTLTADTSTAGTFVYSLESVHDTTTPVDEIIQTGTATVTITPQPDASLGGTGSGTTFNGISAFRICSNVTSLFTFTNISSTSSSLNASYTIDWGDGSPNFSSTTWSTTNHTYAVGYWDLVYTIQSTNGCIISKKYVVFIGSNPAVSLGNPGNTDICNSEQLTFPITGTDNNPSGTTYTITFNDGSSPIVYNHPPPSSISHTFLKSSCGVTSSDGSNSYPNSFRANIVAQNPCGTSAVGVVPIYVSTPPVANFTIPSNGCVNTDICINNTTTGGFENNGSGNSCNTSPKFVWSISPSTGYTIVSGTIGNDFGSNDPNLWLSGSSPLCVKFSQAGIYTVTIKTANRCGSVVTKQQQICIETSLVPQFTLDNSSGCIPQAITTTNTTIETNSCTPPTYLWSVTYAPTNCGTSITIPNQTTKNASYNFTMPGMYTIKLTATNSCGPVNSAQTVEVKKPPTVTIAAISNSCGTAAINPTAIATSCAPASSTLTYAWSFPGGLPATANIANPGTIGYSTTGTHTVSLVVTNECGVSTTATQTFSVNKTPTITNTDLSQILCSGTSSTAVNLTSDDALTTFSWTATATAGISGFVASGTTSTIPARVITTTNSSAGTITYVVTPKIGTCAGTPVNFGINVNPAPSFTTQPVSSSVCLGGTPTQLAVAIGGSAATPSYQWYSNTTNSTTGSILIPSATNSTFDPPTNTVGTIYYYCVVTLPSGGCSNLTSTIVAVTVTAQATISQPLASQNVCTGATISAPLSVSPSGGTGTATYQWYSNTTNSYLGSASILGATTNNYSPAVYTVAGDYYYYAIVSISGSGCGAITSNVARVTVLDAPTITTQPIANQVLCQGDTPTQLGVVGAGGNGGFSYQWYKNNVNNNISGTAIPGETNATYLPPTTTAGTQYYYCVLLQTGVGCTVKSAIASVQVSVSPTITTQPVSSTVCLGGAPTTLSFTISNGVGTPTYQWYSNTTSSNVGGAILAGETNPTYVPLATTAGTIYYYCVVNFPSLSGGCAVVTTNPATVIVNQKPNIASEATTICSSATFTVTPNNSGGNIIPAVTTYTWTNPTISPAATITGASAVSSAQTNISQTLINTSVNPSVVTYTVTPTSGTCVGNTFTVTVIVNPAISANVAINDNTCFGTNTASISTNITGGIPFSSGAPYTISWAGSNGFTSSATAISNLKPGNYDLTVTDNGNCPFFKTYSITEPTDIVISVINKKDISCLGSNNGSIDINVAGGMGNYTYTWTKNGAPFAASQDISSLAPGNYKVSVTDANNCGPKTNSFTIIEPPLLVVSLINKRDVVCFGDATGAINVNVSGGVPATSGYNFAWTGPNGFTSTSQNLTNIVAGTYNLIVTDSQSCSKNLAITITESSEIKVVYSTTPILCYGANNASITASISGGIPPYQYVWSNLATTLNQTNLSAGDYIILVTDNAGCKKSQTITIPEAPIFTVNPIKKDISCFGAHDGSINLNLVGGKAPIALVWSDGSTSGLTRNNLGAGTYTATISDGTPCQIVRTFVIQEPQVLVLSANVTNALDCNNANSGAINLLVSGGTPPFTYSWSNGTTTEDLINVAAGNYLVTVTDARGCTKIAQYSINRPPPIVIGVTTKTDVNCDTKEVKQSFIAQVSGGVPPYQLSWSSGTVSGANNEIMSTTQNGAIVLEVTDALGCKANYSFNVNIPTLGSPSFATNSIGISTYGFYSIKDPIQFTNTSTAGFVGVSWDFGDGSISNENNPVHVYKKEGSYLVIQRVTYPLGCVYNYTLKLDIKKGYNLMHPTAFTPNNDGSNDYFAPAFKGLSAIVFDVYDTWGALIYSEKGDTIKGWDGRIKDQEAENGNYYFKVTAKTFYGATIKDQGAFVLIK